MTNMIPKSINPNRSDWLAERDWRDQSSDIRRERRLMTRTVASRLGYFVIALLVCACTSDESNEDEAPRENDTTTCTMTLGGGLQESGVPCILLWNQRGTGTPYLGGGAQDGHVSFSISDSEPRVGTYSTGGGFKMFGQIIDFKNQNRQWRAAENFPGEDTVGRFTANITSVRDRSVTDASGTKIRQWSIHGTVDATYDPIATTGATGSVTVHIEF